VSHCRASPEAQGQSPQPGAGLLNALRPYNPGEAAIWSAISEAATEEGGQDLITTCRLFKSMNGKKGGKEIERND